MFSFCTDMMQCGRKKNEEFPPPSDAMAVAQYQRGSFAALFLWLSSGWEAGDGWLRLNCF